MRRRTPCLAANVTGDDVRCGPADPPSDGATGARVADDRGHRDGRWHRAVTDPLATVVSPLHRAPAAPTARRHHLSSGFAPRCDRRQLVRIDVHADERCACVSEDATSPLRRRRVAAACVRHPVSRRCIACRSPWPTMSDKTTRGSGSRRSPPTACALSANAGTRDCSVCRASARVCARADGGNLPRRRSRPGSLRPAGVPRNRSTRARAAIRWRRAHRVGGELVEAPIGADWMLDDADGPLPSLTRVRSRRAPSALDGERCAHRRHRPADDLVIRAVAPEEEPRRRPAGRLTVRRGGESHQRDVAQPDSGNGVGDMSARTEAASRGRAAVPSIAFDPCRRTDRRNAPRIVCRDGAVDATPTRPGSCGFEVQPASRTGALRAGRARASRRRRCG